MGTLEALSVFFFFFFNEAALTINMRLTYNRLH